MRGSQGFSRGFWNFMVRVMIMFRAASGRGAERTCDWYTSSARAPWMARVTSSPAEVPRPRRRKATLASAVVTRGARYSRGSVIMPSVSAPASFRMAITEMTSL
jgi:hypothetical protein